MKNIANNITSFIILFAIVVPWLMGIVLAPSWWQKIMSFFPPYAWYLTTKRLMQLGGLI